MMTLVYRDDRAVNHLRKQIIYHSMELENSGHYDSSAGNIEEMTFGNSREDFLRKSDGTSKLFRPSKIYGLTMQMLSINGSFVYYAHFFIPLLLL